MDIARSRFRVDGNNTSKPTKNIFGLSGNQLDFVQERVESDVRFIGFAVKKASATGAPIQSLYLYTSMLGEGGYGSVYAAKRSDQPDDVNFTVKRFSNQEVRVGDVVSEIDRFANVREKRPFLDPTVQDRLDPYSKIYETRAVEREWRILQLVISRASLFPAPVARICRNQIVCAIDRFYTPNLSHGFVVFEGFANAQTLYAVARRTWYEEFKQLDAAPVAARTRTRELSLSLVRNARLRALSVARTVVQTVAYLHKMHIYHRDINPNNVLVRETADGLVEARVIDFGLACAEPLPGTYNTDYQRDERFVACSDQFVTTYDYEDPLIAMLPEDPRYQSLISGYPDDKLARETLQKLGDSFAVGKTLQMIFDYQTYDAARRTWVAPVTRETTAMPAGYFDIIRALTGESANETPTEDFKLTAEEFAQRFRRIERRLTPGEVLFDLERLIRNFLESSEQQN